MTKFVSFKLPIAITVEFCSSEALLGSQKYSCAYLTFALGARRTQKRPRKGRAMSVMPLETHVET